MSEIVATTVAVSRYAPRGANAVEVFSYAGCEGMAFGQLVMAVCCKRAAAVEAQSMNTMNRLTESSSWLQALSSVGQQFLEAKDMSALADFGTSGYVCRKTTAKPTLLQFLQIECGIDPEYLYQKNDKDELTSNPLDIGVFANRMQIFDQLKTRLDDATRQSQEITIELQTLVSRRDVAFNTSAAAVKSLGESMLNTASIL